MTHLSLGLFSHFVCHNKKQTNVVFFFFFFKLRKKNSASVPIVCLITNSEAHPLLLIQTLKQMNSFSANSEFLSVKTFPLDLNKKLPLPGYN